MIDWQNKIIHRISQDLEATPKVDLARVHTGKNENQLQHLVESHIKKADELTLEQIHRISDEFLGAGPIKTLMENPDITEILINSKDQIWFELKGQLYQHDDHFATDLSFKQFVVHVCQSTQIQFNLEKPFADGRWGNFRVHIVAPPLNQNSVSITLRRIFNGQWSFTRLASLEWAQEAHIQRLQQIVSEHHNVLIIGGTGSGKTSVLNACLNHIKSNERTVILEDTDELQCPNTVSVKLLTRSDAQKLLPEITLTDLIRQAMRMRPDRLVVGEVRGGEAKDLLMALATGHRGSFGTLHADDPHQALMRLEMLIQMGMPEWNLETVRRLIALSVQYVIHVGRTDEGKRALKGIHRIAGLENFGFLLHCES